MLKKIFFVILIVSCNSGEQHSSNADSPKLPEYAGSNGYSTADTSFLKLWSVFTDAVQKRDLKTLLELSVDSLSCEGLPISRTTFFSTYFLKVFDDSVMTRLSDSTRIRFINSGIYRWALTAPAQQETEDAEVVALVKVNVTRRDFIDGAPDFVVLEFIKTLNGYKFYGYISRRRIIDRAP